MFRRRAILKFGLGSIIPLYSTGGQPTFEDKLDAKCVDYAAVRSLSTLAASKGLFIGFAINGSSFRESNAHEIVRSHAHACVAENWMKPGNALRDRGSIRTTGIANIVGFAREKQLAVRGHALVYDRSVPQWLADSLRGPDRKAAFVESIDALSHGTAGVISCWDVVNEAIYPRGGRKDGLKNNIFLRSLGSDYIRIAFETAAQSDPNAGRYYSDALEEDTIYEKERRIASVLKLLFWLKEEGLAHGFSWHAHLKTGRDEIPLIEIFLGECERMNIEVVLSELDVMETVPHLTLCQRDELVAETFSATLKVALSSAAVKGIVFWGVTDADSWLSQRRDQVYTDSRGLLFDRFGRPKLAFLSVMRALELAAIRQPTSFNFSLYQQ